MTLSEALPPIDRAEVSADPQDGLVLSFKREGIAGAGRITRDAAEALWRDLDRVFGGECEE